MQEIFIWSQSTSTYFFLFNFKNTYIWGILRSRTPSTTPNCITFRLKIGRPWNWERVNRLVLHDRNSLAFILLGIFEAQFDVMFFCGSVISTLAYNLIVLLDKLGLLVEWVPFSVSIFSLFFEIVFPLGSFTTESPHSFNFSDETLLFFITLIIARLKSGIR